MVRTKANNAAVRKAVAAKAPRKNLGGGVRSVSATSSPSSRKGKSKLGSSSNPVKAWPKPEWQKGIDIFLSPNSKGSSSSFMTSSSSSNGGCSSNNVQEGSTKLDESTATATSDGEEMEERETTDNETDDNEDLLTESEEESEIDEKETAASKIAMLSKDLVCGNDDD